MRFFACLTLAIWLAGVAGAQSTSQPALTTTKQLVDALVEEAKQAMRERHLPGLEPDASDRFDFSPPANELSEAMTMRVHREPFIDAYVRWQLISFEPQLPDMDDRTFARFMDRAPAMVENPRADEAFVELLETVEANETRLTGRDANQLRGRLAELEAQTHIAEHMNIPAQAYRDWVREQLPRLGPRRYQWLLEECYATIRAGWPTRQPKANITKNFTTSAGDTTLTPSQRQMILAQAERLVGMSRRSIKEVNILANHTIVASFSTSQVTNSDLTKWRDRLMSRAIGGGR